MEVFEDAGLVNVTVAVMEDMLADNAQVTVGIYTVAGTASGQSCIANDEQQISDILCNMYGSINMHKIYCMYVYISSICV